MLSLVTWRGMSGSSPLARGLRGDSGLGIHFSGIIPARAGFTNFITAGAPVSADHPRSRGVYVRYRIMCGVLSWIIPARAGFTGTRSSPASPGPDHPRSRGVYGEPRHILGWRGGSSPLARGLPADTAQGDDSRGIIPARAGFTAFEASAEGRGTDHPRSRGVYGGMTTVAPSSAGSSPLARGLPPQPCQPSEVCRIIPARAGFTSEHGQPGRMSTDHPRSRGVYSRDELDKVWETGSSPLARGLLAGGMAAGVVARIIPARAGFTI